MLMLNLNEPIKVGDLLKLVNQPVLNDAFLISTIIFLKTKKAFLV